MPDTIEKVRNEITGVAQEIKSQLHSNAERLDKLELAGKRPNYGDAHSDGKGTGFTGMLDGFARKGGSGLETKATDLQITDDQQGVTVRPEWSERMMELWYSIAPIRALGANMSTMSNELELLVDKEQAEGAWIAETASRDATNAPSLVRHNIPLYELYALPAVSNHLLEDDQIDVGSWLERKIVRRMSELEGTAFTSGNGSGKPTGILDYGIIEDKDWFWPDAPDDYVLGALATGVDGDFPASDPADVLFDLVDRLESPYRSNARWMMNRKTLNAIRKMKDGNDNYLLDQMRDARDNRLLGFPVAINENMPDYGTPDAKAIVFGDFREAYTVVDRDDVQILRDPYSRKGFTQFYIRTRVGGAVVNPQALKVLDFGTDVSS